MHGATRIKITDLNARLTCKLCGGYYIDATTIVECLHSFCKACIVKYLENNKYCPVCEVQVHKTKPLLNIKSDTTLQDMVYKLVPGLFKSEMKRRRDFWAAHPDEYALIMDPEDRGEVHENRFIYIPHEDINLCLEYWDGESEVVPNGGDQTTKNEDQSEEKSEGSDEAVEKSHRRFLRAPAAVTITHLKKFIRFKYGFPANYVIDLVYESEVLSDDYTLIDVAYIYSWRRNGPMKLRYRIQDPKISNPTKKLKTSHNSDANSDASTNPTLPPPLLPAPNGSKSAGPTSGGDEAAATKSVNVNAKSHSANKSNCPPPSQPTTHTPLGSVDDKQKSAAGETPCRTSTPMEVDLRPSSVTFTPIVTPLVNGNSTSPGVEGDKLGVEVLNISGKDNNKAVVEIMIKSSVTIEPVMDKSPTVAVANDKDTRPFSIHTPEPPTQEVIITKVIADDNSSSITSRTPTPKDSIEIKPTKIVPISTKDVTVKEITTSSSAPTLPNDNSTKDGGTNNNSVVVVVLASKEPPEIPVTTNSNNSGNCHSSGGSVSTSPPVHLPVPDISITPIPLWTTTTPTSSPSNNSATLTPAAPRSSTSAAIVRDTLRTTNPQVEIIKKVAPLSVTENGSSTPATSFTPSITTVTPVVMNCNGSNNVGSSPSITFSPSSTTIITTSATDTTMTITITSTPVKPSTSTPTVSSTSLTPVTVTTTTTSTAGGGHVESSGNNNNGGGGDDDDPPKHDNIGALDLSRNSRGSHSPQSPRSPRSFAAAPSPASASTNGGCMLPPVSTMCFTTPPPSLRLPTQTQVRSVTSKSLTLSSAGAASITTITVPNAHSRVLPVVTAPTCSSPHHAHSPHAQVQQHARSSHLPINSVHLSALKPSARNCLNGVVSAVNARSLQLQQQQQQQHHHHHHHHNLHHPHTHGPQQLQTQSTQQQQQPTSHHFQNRATFAKNIITPFGASKAAKKPEQVRHRTSFDKSPIIPNSNAFHNGDKVIESGASATTTI